MMMTLPQIYKKQHSYDLNTLLQFLNIAILLLIFVTYIINGGNNFVDNYTVGISVTFAIQNSLLLFWEKKSREPLLMLLMLTIIPFYLLRVATLLYEPWSEVLPRFPFSPNDMNHALLFIMLSTLSLCLGIKSADFGDRFSRKTRCFSTFSENAPTRLFVIMIVIIIFDVLSVLGENIFGSFRGFISILLNADIVLILLITVFAIKYTSLSLNKRYSYIFLFFLFLVVRTLSGSRSALLTAALSVLYVYFAMMRKVRIKKQFLVLIIMILPLLPVMFSVTTFWRPYRIAKLQGVIEATPADFVTEYLNNVTSDAFEENLKIVLRPMFDRAGYLDMAADMITNNDKYNAVINPIYYIKSVIDNVFTPGYDVFNVPKAATNTVSIYNNIPLLDKVTVDNYYQSDMFTIFGEFYVMFRGYFAVFACFLMGFFSKLLFEVINFNNMLWHYSCRAIFFKLYVLSLWSFGLDWQLGDILFFLISIGCLYVLTAIKLPKITLFCTGRRFAANKLSN